MPDLRFSVSDGREFLARHDLLGHLTPEELDHLLAPARVERLDEGRVLFRKGDPGDRLYVVLSGRISIGTTSEAGKEVVFNVLGRGEVFGEIALLDGKARTADATAMAESHLLVLERADFMPFLERHPEVAARLIAVLCERVAGSASPTRTRCSWSCPRASPNASLSWPSPTASRGTARRRASSSRSPSRSWPIWPGSAAKRSTSCCAPGRAKA